MTKKYKILARFVKDMSSETPDIDAYIFVKDNISNYSLQYDIKSKPLKNKIIQVETKLIYSDKSENKKKNDILYISTFRNSQLNDEKRILVKNYTEKDYKLNNWLDHELRLLKWLKLYSLAYKRQISILGSQIDEKNEIKFYKRYKS